MDGSRQKELGVHIIEVGPGRGTLMDDMLRVLHRNTPTMMLGYLQT